MHGELQTLGEPQATAVDELQRRAVAAQADVFEQRLHLLASEHRRQRVVILRLHLIKEPPAWMAQLLDEEHLGRGQRLPDGLGLPMAHRLHMQQVVAQHLLGEQRRITAAEVLAQEAQLPVVTVPRARRIITQRQQLREALHRRPSVRVGERVRIQLAALNACRHGRAPRRRRSGASMRGCSGR